MDSTQKSNARQRADAVFSAGYALMAWAMIAIFIPMCTKFDRAVLSSYIAVFILGVILVPWFSYRLSRLHQILRDIRERLDQKTESPAASPTQG